MSVFVLLLVSDGRLNCPHTRRATIVWSEQSEIVWRNVNENLLNPKKHPGSRLCKKWMLRARIDQHFKAILLSKIVYYYLQDGFWNEYNWIFRKKTINAFIRCTWSKKSVVKTNKDPIQTRDNIPSFAIWICHKSGLNTCPRQNVRH